MVTRAPIKSQALAIIKKRGVPVKTVLDVGVLSGTPELIWGFPYVPHVLFEPVAEFEKQIRDAYKALTYNLNLVAVGESDGTVNLEIFSKIQGMDISHSSMYFGQQENSSAMRIVPSVKLDTFVERNNLEGPFLLKIDIDGHELKVLKGAKNVLKNCSVVIIECPRDQFTERICAVQDHGFTLFDLCAPCYYDKSFWQCDAIFIRNDFYNKFFKNLTDKVEPGLYEEFTG